MNIGILQTGTVNEALAAEFGQYPEMFLRLYRSVDPSVRITTYSVIDGVFPESPSACDGWLVTGSKHGVYDDLPWIEPLKEFLRQARSARVPLVGICFGHQIMAEAFGGQAEKSSKGWGCGVHRYSVVECAEWMEASPGGFAMHAMHQDQVTRIPEDATCLASSEFCEFAMLSYGDLDCPDAISIQPHPEFEAPYGKALVALRAGDLIPSDRAEPAIETFGTPVANLDFARWSIAYIQQMRRRRAAA